MKVSCKICKRNIEADNINVAKDVAYCQDCGAATSLSFLVESAPSKSFVQTL